ncbi:MAG TPA: type II toxin-antitoxin system HicA family toxin [Allocoleopsis sp.]
MSKIPIISGKECVKTLTKIGFYKKRQEGSHIILRRDNPFCQVIVPDHQVIAKGTLRSIIKSVGLSVNEFIELL